MNIYDAKDNLKKIQAKDFDRERLYLFYINYSSEDIYLLDYCEITELCENSPSNRVYIKRVVLLALLKFLNKNNQGLCLVHCHPVNFNGRKVFFSFQDTKFMKETIHQAKLICFNNLIVFGVFDKNGFVFKYYNGSILKKCRA